MRAVKAVAAVMLGACGSSGVQATDARTGDALPHDAAPSDAPIDAPDGPGFRIGGSALGMRHPTLLTLTAGMITREVVVTEDGTFRFPGRVPDGTSFTVAVPATCAIPAASGQVAGGDVTSVMLYCHGIVELTGLGLSFPVQSTPLVPAPVFSPGAATYTATRTYFTDPTDTLTVTPAPAYPGVPSLAVDGVAMTGTTASQPIGTTTTVQLDHASGLTQTYSVAVGAGLPRQLAYVKASDSDANDLFGSGDFATYFGSGVALSGDVLVVGAPAAEPTTTGAVYVYRRVNDVWAAPDKLTPATTAAGAGGAVAIDGTTLVIGAPLAAVGGAASAGTIYVYRWNGAAWAADPAITAPVPAAGDLCGMSVAVSGTTLVFGCPSSSTGSGGAAYVYVFNGAAWVLQQKLVGANTGTGDVFGRSVAIAADTVVIGAMFEDGSATTINGADNNSATNAGAAYVFVRSGTAWTQQAYLKPGNLEAADFFGCAVSIDGDYVAVGAFGEDSGSTSPADNTASNAGAAYVFHRSGTAWAQDGYIKALAPVAGMELGKAVAIDRTHLVVGAHSEKTSTPGIDPAPNTNALDAGAAYTYRRVGTSWTTDSHFIKASNPDISDNFGSSVAIDNDTFAVAAFGEASSSTGVNSTPNNTAPNAGAVYVFR